jgi:hypothetical protein
MKKAQMDLIFIPVMILVLVVAVFMGSIVLSSFLDEYIDTSLGLPIITQISGTLSRIADTLDYFLPIFIVGLGIIMLVISFLVNAHPLYYVLSIAILFSGVITGAVISNVLIELDTQTSGYTATLLPITKDLIQYIPYIFIGIAVLTTIAFYGKWGTAGGGNAI